jgi:hypothetical protein
MSCRVKWSSERRRWVFDWNGIALEEARKHGYRPRLVADPVTPAAQFRVPVASILAAVEKAIAPAVRRLKADRLKRERARRRDYFARWYALNRLDLAARRKLKRQATRLPSSFDATTCITC